MSGWKKLAEAVGIGIAVTALYLLLPLGTALQLGGDEGYEVMVAFLMSKGYVLYTQIWSDQPPVRELLLKWVFQTWGPSILAARLVAAAFGVSLFAFFHLLVRERAGQRTALFATFLLLASPIVLELSVSFMAEVPTFATALSSVSLLFYWRRREHFLWLIASGMIMGVAFGMKLTAVLVVPAAAVEVLLASASKLRDSRLKSAWRNIGTWGTAALGTYALIHFLWGRGSFQSSWRSHFAEHAVEGLGKPEAFGLGPDVFVNHFECVIGALAGLGLVIYQRRWRAFSFPICLLVFGLAVHSVHRPWWTFYYLHLAIPIAWLSGYAVSETVERITTLLNRGRPIPGRALKIGGLCVLMALPVVRSAKRLQVEAAALRGRERLDSSPVLAAMKKYSSRTHWAYVQFSYEIYAFHAGLPMPPELAMVSLKRFWSNQISNAEVVQVCRKYGTEEILLKKAAMPEEWTEFLKSGYTIVYQDQEWALYVANGLWNLERDKRSR